MLRQRLLPAMLGQQPFAGPYDVAACCKAAWTSPVRTAATSTIQHDGKDASTSGAAPVQHSNTTDWDWAFVIGAKAGRKPAIKRMQRHQWYFCNPNYDPAKPLPRRILPPHAPPSAAHVDDWQLFHSTLGSQMSARSRQEFVRFLKLRDVDWRNAFQRGLADYVREFKQEQRHRAEKQRQQAWSEYREQLFAKALEQPAEQQQR